MTKKITFLVKHLTYENGADEVIVVTPQQYAGLKRTKGWKKKLIASKNKAEIQLIIKTH